MSQHWECILRKAWTTGHILKILINPPSICFWVSMLVFGDVTFQITVGCAKSAPRSASRPRNSSSERCISTWPMPRRWRRKTTGSTESTVLLLVSKDFVTCFCSHMVFSECLGEELSFKVFWTLNLEYAFFPFFFPCTGTKSHEINACCDFPWGEWDRIFHGNCWWMMAGFPQNWSEKRNDKSVLLTTLGAAIQS